MAGNVHHEDEGCKLGNEVRVDERGHVFGIGKGVREEEDELKQERGEPFPQRGGEGGAAERERGERKWVPPRGGVPGQRGDELVGKDDTWFV